MSRKLRLEIDLDLDNKEYDVRFKKLSEGRDFDIDYWHVRNMIHAVLWDLDNKVKKNGTSALSKVTMN